MNYELFFVCTQCTCYIIIKYVKPMSALFYSEHICLCHYHVLFRFIRAAYVKYFFVVSIGTCIESQMLFEYNMY